jgi:16S rRNA (guanine527-N7)-methyltransferase
LGHDNRRRLAQGADQLGLELDGKVLDRLIVYLAELIKWNRRVNLIARDTSVEQAIELHFLDSLTLLPLLREAGAPVHLLDVGSGAGFPGLVLACALPEARVTLAEPRQKRVTFLRHLIHTLQAANTEVVADRIEAHVPAWQGRFSHITGRAVAEPALFLPLIRPLATAETMVLLMLVRPEPLAGISSLPGGGWRVVRTSELVLPFSGAPRLLATVQPI